MASSGWPETSDSIGGIKLRDCMYRWGWSLLKRGAKESGVSGSPREARRMRIPQPTRGRKSMHMASQALDGVRKSGKEDDVDACKIESKNTHM
jgi:hypothetical protein